jgi:hypothetical protein
MLIYDIPVFRSAGRLFCIRAVEQPCAQTLTKADWSKVTVHEAARSGDVVKVAVLLADHFRTVVIGRRGWASA